MLGKLIKHEFRATGRIFLFVYLAVIVIAILNLVVVPWESIVEHGSYSPDTSTLLMGILRTTITTLYVLSIVAAVVVTLVVNIIRFYKNLLGDEGYLMFTLPVSKDSLIISKLVVAFVWNICTYVIIILSMLILFGRFDLFEAVGSFFDMARSQGINVTMWILMIVIAIILYTLGALMMLYSAMSIGPNIIKNRLGGSILAYIIIYIITQIISTFILVGAGLLVDRTGIDWGAPTVGISNVQITNIVFNTVIGTGLILNAIIIIAGYITTRLMLKNKLNLT